jgi:hypothetical protein
MQRDSKAAVADELEHYWEAGTYGHATAAAQVLERLPSGEHAWLRPEVDQVEDSNPAESDDALYIVTDLGRRALAQYALFGPCPTVAEARR